MQQREYIFIPVEEVRERLKINGREMEFDPADYWREVPQSIPRDLARVPVLHPTNVRPIEDDSQVTPCLLLGMDIF